MVQRNICGLLWLSGWMDWERNAKSIASEWNLLERAARVNPLASSGWMKFARVAVSHGAPCPTPKFQVQSR